MRIDLDCKKNKTVFAITVMMLLSLLFCNLTFANSSISNSGEDKGGRRPDAKPVEKHDISKTITFNKRLEATGGTLNTVVIKNENDEGYIVLNKAYVFVDDGLNSGNVHLHNVKIDGFIIAHFNMGELSYVKAPETEGGIKARGGELTHILRGFMNIDDLELVANESIEFDFMSMMSNDPSPTPVSIMVHAKSFDGAKLNISLQE